MTLTTRERYIAIGVAAAVGLLGLSHFVLSPYQEQRTQISRELEGVQKIQAANARTFKRRKALLPVWAEINAGGLKADRSEAGSQVQSALQAWAQESGLNVASLKLEKDVQEHGFVQISFHLTGTGPMAAISRLMWRIESATIPIRVVDMQINPRREEGTDDLQLQLNVSTLASEKAPGATAMASADVKGERP